MEKINVILVNNNNQELEKQLNEFFKKDEKFNIIAEEKFDVKTLDKIGYKNPDVLIINTHKVTQVIIDFIEKYILQSRAAPLF